MMLSYIFLFSSHILSNILFMQFYFHINILILISRGSIFLYFFLFFAYFFEVSPLKRTFA